MKKILISGLMVFLVGSSVFARTPQRMEGRAVHRQHCDYYYSNENKNYPVSQEVEKIKVAFAEKRLEIRKELLKDVPDWEKIKKLNEELALRRAELRTENMKKRFEERKKLSSTK